MTLAWTRLMIAQEVFTIAMAHEFFDAMPINLFEVRPSPF